MPAINPVSLQVAPQKLSFTAKPAKDLAGEVQAWEKEGKGGKAKKAVGLLALLAIVGGVVLHKVPADKLPQLLQPVKAKIADLVKWVADKLPKAKQAAEQVVEKAKDAVAPVIDKVA